MGLEPPIRESKISASSSQNLPTFDYEIIDAEYTPIQSSDLSPIP
jgi:hypothetical protein